MVQEEGINNLHILGSKLGVGQKFKVFKYSQFTLYFYMGQEISSRTQEWDFFVLVKENVRKT